MAILVLGSSGTVLEVDGSTFRALRIANRPSDAVGERAVGDALASASERGAPAIEDSFVSSS